MPYQAGNRLPAERASRLGHLEVLQSELVRRLCQSFEYPQDEVTSTPAAWQALPTGARPLSLIFGVDGSMQAIASETQPPRELAFVKTAILRLDGPALARVDKASPHPFALRDIMRDAALYHATVFPLKNSRIPGLSVYHAVRQIVYESLADASLNREPLETLKWLLYEKWTGQERPLGTFQCPHCEESVATLPYDAETGTCPGCGGHLYISDMIGFHQDMSVDAVPELVPLAYMRVHELLLLFTGIRLFWQQHRALLPRCLWVKDGPLTLDAQYAKLVPRVRRFLAHARDTGFPVHIIGQEKTGRFCDHLSLIARAALVGSLFLPSSRYVNAEIQRRPERGFPYGRDTNYGAKVFVKLNDYHAMVLSIPTGEYVENPAVSDLIGLDAIAATLPVIVSNRYEGALLPIELAHGIASLSTYPSAQILKMFAGSSQA